MNAITQALSAALLHFVWQGTIVGLLLWLTLFVFRRRSANVRYAASCAALATLALLPAITTALLYARALPMDARALPIVANPRALGDIPRTAGSVWFGSESGRIVWLTLLQAWALPLWSVGVVSLRFIGAPRLHGIPSSGCAEGSNRDKSPPHLPALCRNPHI